MELTSFIQRLFINARGNREFEGIEHVVHAGFSFANLAVIVTLHGIDRLVHLFGGLVLVAGQAGFLHVVARRGSPVNRVHLAGLFVLDLRHMAGSAGSAGLVVRRAEVRFSVRMLHLHERCARKVVLEVTETDLVVVLLDLVGIDKREVVGQAAVEADLGARLGIKAGLQMYSTWH